MNWKLIGLLAWHGLSQVVITIGGVLVALKDWPDSWGWFVAILAGGLAGVKGIQGYIAEPSK